MTGRNTNHYTTSDCRGGNGGSIPLGHILVQHWGCSSLGRAVGSQSAGTGIETLLLHIFVFFFFVFFVVLFLFVLVTVLKKILKNYYKKN